MKDEQAWLIDLDGTLYAARWVKLAMSIELLCFGRMSIRVLRTFRQVHEELREGGLAVGEHSSPYQVQIERAAARLGLSPDEVQTCVVKWMFQRPAKWLRLCRNRRLLGEIERFRAGGGKTAIVSDYPAQEKLAALGVEGLFDAVVASGEPDGPLQLKPAPDGYELAARCLDVVAASCVVLGDRDDADGEAARRAGMKFRLIG